MKNITIIGGGACGTAVFVELVLQINASNLSQQVEITIIERDERLGYGLAFGTHQKGHLLNTKAELMGIHVHEPEHFANWLKRRGGKCRDDVKGKGQTEEAYTSRSLYGDYVSEQLKYYLEQAKRMGITVNTIQAEAIDVQKAAEGYEVICDDGQRLPADYIVLALGTPKPTNYADLMPYPEYIDFPWPSYSMVKHIQKEDHVGILGTSLSAIDAVMTLVDNGHRGPITLVSPDGLLPRVQPAADMEYQRQILTLSKIHQVKRDELRKLTVADILQLFKQEVETCAGQAIDWQEKMREGRSADQLLAEDIAMAEKGGDALSHVIYSLRYDAGVIWQMWDAEEQQQFKKKLGTLWMIYRHAMPLHNAYRLKGLFDKKQLEVCAGLEDVIFQEDQRVFKCVLEKDENRQVHKLVNATGSPSDLDQMDCPLIDNLLDKQMLYSYPVGGALIDRLTMQAVSAEGGAGIYTLGHLANGMLLDVNAVWYNVRTAAILCEHLLCKIKYGSFS